jgi:acyl-coenzyme A synthetase/AMP-(fatty) acid ligase/acyl carrier protein
VLAGHGQILNRIEWMWREYPFVDGEVGCHRTPLSFVDSLWELLGPLLKGVPTLIVSDEAARDPVQLAAELAQHRVTRLWLIPPLLAALLDSVPQLGLRLPDLRFWVTSGEALPSDLEQRFRRTCPHAALYNLYGTSETWDATWHDPRRDGPYGKPASIGRPIANMRTYVLDRHSDAVPVGVPGELYVGGIGVATGYVNAPALTAEKFTVRRVNGSAPERLYRTGDLVRWRGDRTLEYIGRIDRQIKLNGHRIEPGEIEAALRMHPSVQQAAVVLQESNGDVRLVAYCTTQGGDKPERASIRHFLAERLPDWMLPGALLWVDALPLTPSGKLDRRALAGLATETDEAIQHDRPVNPVEERLLAVWQELLGRSDIGTHDDFFTKLGGHSLLAMRLVSRIRASFGVDLPVRRLFEAPTIAGMADAVTSADGSNVPRVPELKRQAREQYRM